MELTVSQNTALLTGASILQKVVSFFYFILIARLIGDANTGMYFLAIVFTTVFIVVADFGMGLVLTREAARYPDRAERYFHTVFTTKIFFGLAAYLFVVLTVNALHYSESFKILVYVSGITMYFDNLATAFNSTFRAKRNLIFESISIFGSQLITLIIGTVALFNGWPLIWLILAYTIPSFLNIIYGSVVIKKYYGFKLSFSWDPQIFKLFFAIAAPFALAGILGRLYSYSDSFLMSKILTDKELGWWSVPYKITFALQFIPVSLSASVFPAFSNLFVTNREKIGQLFVKSWRYLFFIVFPISAGLFAIAGPIITKIYGQNFAAAIPTFKILLISLVFGYHSFITAALLNATNKQKIQTSIIASALALNLVLNILFMSKYRINAAAFSALMSNILLCFAGLFYARKQVAIDLNELLKLALKTLLPAIIMGLAVYYLSFKMNFLLTIPIGAFIYFVLLFINGSISLKNIRTIWLKISKKNNAV
ncbi:MAG: flippase [Patescibacteria group bacterium]